MNKPSRVVKEWVDAVLMQKIEYKTDVSVEKIKKSFSVSEVNGKLFFTGIVKDLTETKVIQEQMKRSERLAALGQVVAEITHEIKNPLMTIGGFAGQLSHQNCDEKELNKLQIITKEVARLEKLIKELREFYLPKTLNHEVINVKDLLNEVYSQTQHDCKEKRIFIKIKADNEPLAMEGDRDKLKQVLLNLVQNAVEAMEDGGKLLIRSRGDDNEVEITIQDNGCGIPKKNQQRIFSPFFTTKSGGTGLGLSISKSIIEDHPKSTFKLESEEGKGTTFIVRLPMGSASAGEQGSYQHEEAHSLC